MKLNLDSVKSDTAQESCGNKGNEYVSVCGLFSVSEPDGEVIEKYIMGGDNVTLRCSVDFQGPETPYIEWTDDNDNVVHGASEWTNTSNDNESDALVYVSELNVIVPDDVEYLPPYTCTVRFYSYYQRPRRRRRYSYIYGSHSYDNYANVYTAYNWTSPEVKVSCK